MARNEGRLEGRLALQADVRRVGAEGLEPFPRRAGGPAAEALDFVAVYRRKEPLHKFFKTQE